MIHEISRLDDDFISLLQGDPVRPHIPVEDRVGVNARVLVLTDQNSEPQSVVCVSFLDQVPVNEQELFNPAVENPSVAALYTIWSLKPGGGQSLVQAALSWIKINKPGIKRILTLSPLTMTARRFHIKNGARELQVNFDTVNFEYTL